MRGLVLAGVLMAPSALAQEPPEGPEAQVPLEAPKAAPRAPQSCQGGVCMPSKDMAVFLEVLREKRCLKTTKPDFQLDEVVIVTDKDGRVFYSGADPKPYTLTMKWCNYELEASGKVQVVAAMMAPETWGFRFRSKAYLGALPLEMLRDENEATDGIDAGLMVDFFYYEWVNLNAGVGFRSLGAGVGFDLTNNFGGYVGYAITWSGFRSTANGALWFAF